MCTRIESRWAGGVLPLAAVVLVVVTAGTTFSAASGDLLQKAIYTEETVGNLDEAMKLYEQVISEGKAGQEAAAQAQYRLGLCHLKKGEEAEAKAAFEKLIADYPDAKELIAKAREHVPSPLNLLPAPWADGERLQLDMKLPTGVEIGTMIYTVSAEQDAGKPVWHCSSRGLVTMNDAVSASSVICDKESFAPIRSHWKHSLLGEADAVYKQDEVEIKLSNKPEPIKIEFEPPVFDNEQAVELFRRLPIAVGYKATVPIVTSLGGNKIEIPVSVPEIETLEVPAGSFKCYKIELGLVAQTFWVSTDEHRYVVRFAAGVVTADLTKIDQPKAAESEQVRGENYSLTLPASWNAYQPDETSKKQEGVETFLLDPQADARAQINVRTKLSLKEEQRESPKALVKSDLDKLQGTFTDFKVREPGVSDIQVGGQAASSMVADFTHDGKKMTTYDVAVFGEKSAAIVRLTTEPEKFDELRKDFDKIVESLKVE
jgi:hypothetical protein